MKLTLRSVSVALAMTLSAVAAHAELVLPVNATQSNSVLAFSDKILKAFKATDVSSAAAGNATPTPNTAEGASYTFPITKVVIGSKLNIASGSAVGSALLIKRVDYDMDPPVEYVVTLANFTIDYTKNQVLADTTPKGGTTVAQMPLYNFHTSTPKTLEKDLSLHEVLDQLVLTEQAKGVFLNNLHVPDIFVDALNLDFGTLTQDVNILKFRKTPVPTKPYVAQ